MKKTLTLIGLAAATLAGVTGANAQIVISGFMANTAGTDSPYEYVQLVATQNINFGTTNFSVVFANNGSATANGWVAGGAITYGFNLTSGSVTAGDVFYVGGDGKLINGASSTDISSATWIRAINTGTTAGDGFGNSNSSGVLGNGGSNADGIAVFSGLTTSLTDASNPIDAVFFGTGLGTAVVSGGTDGYVLPANDLYSGGFLGSTGNTFLFADPASGVYTKLTGTYNNVSNTWTVARTGSQVTSPTSLTDISSGITIVPEPSTFALLGAAAGLTIIFRRRRKA